MSSMDSAIEFAVEHDEDDLVYHARDYYKDFWSSQFAEISVQKHCNYIFYLCVCAGMEYAIKTVQLAVCNLVSKFAVKQNGVIDGHLISYINQLGMSLIDEIKRILSNAIQS